MELDLDSANSCRGRRPGVHKRRRHREEPAGRRGDPAGDPCIEIRACLRQIKAAAGAIFKTFKTAGFNFLATFALTPRRQDPGRAKL